MYLPSVSQTVYLILEGCSEESLLLCLGPAYAYQFLVIKITWKLALILIVLIKLTFLAIKLIKLPNKKSSKPGPYLVSLSHLTSNAFVRRKKLFFLAKLCFTTMCQTNKNQEKWTNLCWFPFGSVLTAGMDFYWLIYVVFLYLISRPTYLNISSLSKIYIIILFY